MPTYSYACTECDHRFDAVQSFSDDSLTVCPVCEGRLRKVFSAVGVVFKGGGFYRTDSRSGSSASMPAGKSDSGSNGSSDSGSSSSSGSDSGSSSGSSSSGSSSSGSSSGSAAKAGASSPSSSSKAADGSAA
ncbi:FmdB family transcriptional regulator [Phycicoccus sp. Root563]|uniref:FmdB family zinc ribbon protein n=1 Tax=Phycicoccus sp. Root563 TaxID=1736562 RepID=UPI0007038DF2|nr:FmdB family zinc ribbon protein [Phycicoccus sp. Root563]KQZ90273.1 FmdB family transcriptional regulator [Phycicoccus sp. Root563]